MSIRNQAAKLSFGKKIELFEIDATAQGGGIHRLTPNRNPAAPALSFLGNLFTPFPFETSGFEWNQDGSFPRPTVMISDPDGWLSDEVEQNDDYVGAKVTRWITKEEYLDGNPETSYYGPEVWTINAKTEVRHGLYIKFQLASEIDARQAQIPRRVMLRDEFPALGLVRVR
jgi:lambda family phage minor tail protein L